METEQLKIKGYRATLEGGVLTVFDVPIFVECERGDVVFDAAWLRKAAAYAKQAEVEDYFPPLHIRHHDSATDITDAVRSAGFFKITGVEKIKFKGKQRFALMADLVVTDEWAQHDVLEKRLPYRSVEIFDVDEPAIMSLALLDHEAPYLELPMMFVTELERKGPQNGAGRKLKRSDRSGVASATFANPWKSGGFNKADPVVACFRRGHSAHVFTQELDAMSDEETIEEPTTDPATGEDTPENFEKGEDDKGEQMAAGDEPEEKPDPIPDTGGDDGNGGEMEGNENAAVVEEMVECIRSGSISVGGLEMLKAAIEEREAAAAPAQQQPMQPPAVSAAPAPAPGEAMSKRNPEVAALHGEIEALKAVNLQRDERDKRKTDVDEAVQRLDGKPLGANLRERLTEYHTEHGAAAFKAHVDAMVQTFAAVGYDSEDAPYDNPSAPLTDAASAYASISPDAEKLAGQFSREWQELKRANFTSMSEENYIRVNMERKGLRLKKTAAK